jgi:hypothetical protein
VKTAIAAVATVVLLLVGVGAPPLPVAIGALAAFGWIWWRSRRGAAKR